MFEANKHSRGSICIAYGQLCTHILGFHYGFVTSDF